MTVADLELQVAQIVSDAIGAGAPKLWHGLMPQDCCPGAGSPASVSVSWERIAGASDRPPGTAAVGDCSAPVLLLLRVRAYVCWPTPADPLNVTEGDLDAAATVARTLAENAYDGEQALRTNLICLALPEKRNQFGVRGAWLTGVVPLNPQGGCAGVEWQVTVQPTGSWPT